MYSIEHGVPLVEGSVGELSIQKWPIFTERSTRKTQTCRGYIYRISVTAGGDTKEGQWQGDE
jgi:hypothetical protein